MFIFKKARPAAFKSRLDRYIDANGDELIRLLCRAWDGQRNAMTYDRIGLGLLNGFDGIFREWQQEYAELVNTELARHWLDAANAGARLTEGRFEDFVFDDTAREVRDWIRDHGADFVVQITEQTRLAIGSVVALGQMQGLTNERIAHNIRPLIGLTRCQSLANHNYYERQLRALTRDHPKTSAEKLEEIARARQARYAGRQHRYRADTIATTELAFAYNKGYHESVRQAMQRGFMGPCVKVWSTAQSERTCPTCAALNGERIGFDDKFSYSDRTGLQETPPAHPRCRCTVKYEETGEAGIRSDEMVGGNKQDYAVNMAYVNDNDYAKKFAGLTGNAVLNDNIRKTAREMLQHRQGTAFEDGAVFNMATGERLLLHKTAAEPSSCDMDITPFLKDNVPLLAMHSHPGSAPFSFSDYRFLFHYEQVKASVVIGHSGAVYCMEKIKGTEAEVVAFAKPYFDEFKADWEKTHSRQTIMAWLTYIAERIRDKGHISFAMKEGGGHDRLGKILRNP